MITGKIRVAAKPVAFMAGMRNHPWGGVISCSRKTAAFAKEILDKYTKILNYQFDPVSLIFLERMADHSGLEESDERTVILTCRLLSYLVQNMGQASLFSDHYSFLVQQLTGQVERNLEILKESVPDAGAELDRCYLEYQKLISVDHIHAKEPGRNSHENIMDAQNQDKGQDTDGVYQVMHGVKQIRRLQEKIYQLERRQGTSGYPEWTKNRIRQMDKKEETQEGKLLENLENRMPFVMTQVFFTNLNHWTRENRISNFRQMWKQANERQLIHQELTYHMQQFLQEEDFIRQEEQLSGMLQQYGKETVLEYLTWSDFKEYEKLLPVLHVLSGPAGKQHGESSRQGYQSLDSRYMETANGQIQMKSRTGQEASDSLEGKHEPQMNWMLGGQEAEDDVEVFSDAEIELLLKDAASQPVSAEQETAELKLKLFAFREITEQFLEEGSSVLHQGTLREIMGVLDQDAFLHGWQLTEYQKADAVLLDIMSKSDDVTKNMLQEKAEEYQDLFYQYIRAGHPIEQTAVRTDTVSQTEHAGEKRSFERIAEENPAEKTLQPDLAQQEDIRAQSRQKENGFLDTYQRRAQSEYQTAESQLRHLLSECDEVTRNMLQEKAQEYQDLFYDYIQTEYNEEQADGAENQTEENPEIFSDAEIKLLLQKKETGTDSQEQKKAEQKLKLVAYREITEQFLKEGSAVLQHENLQKIAGVLSELEVRPSFAEQASFKEADGALYDIRKILEHGSLPERKLFYLTAEKAVDELLIGLKETETVTGMQQKEHMAAELADRKKTDQAGQFLQLKKQLMHIGGQDYHGADDWGFLLTDDVSRELLEMVQQKENPASGVLVQRIQQSLTDFYDQIEKTGPYSEMPDSSSLAAEWNPVFRREEWQLLGSVARNRRQKEIPEEALLRQAARSQPDPGEPGQQMLPGQPGRIPASGSRNQQMSEIRAFFESAGLESVLVTGSRQELHPAAPGYSLVLKSFQKEITDSGQPLLLTQQNKDFMQPPAQDSRNRLDSKPQPVRDHLAGRKTASETAAIVHTDQGKGNHADQIQRMVREKEQEQKQELQRLEGSLLDYRSDLRTKTLQLDQVEKKLEAQEKELKQMRESQRMAAKRGKSAAERQKAVSRLKQELQLERMRNGFD